MKRALGLTLAAGAAATAALWTVAARGVRWLLQAVAGVLEGGSTAAAMHAVTAWTERRWVQYWLDAHEADALRDGVDWLLGLRGGPAAWLGSTLALLGAALVLVWAGGLVLGALAALSVLAIVRRLVHWWLSGLRFWRPAGSGSAAGVPSPTPVQITKS